MEASQDFEATIRRCGLYELIAAHMEAKRVPTLKAAVVQLCHLNMSVVPVRVFGGCCYQDVSGFPKHYSHKISSMLFCCVRFLGAEGSQRQP